ncbi:MAG: efflux RND transporter periplasmic adaptor subunit [Magnetococcales bacterium]|nr:efflux RND transporter periplasmic adaptor subunit [Magnetococcales bacterium]
MDTTTAHSPPPALLLLFLTGITLALATGSAWSGETLKREARVVLDVEDESLISSQIEGRIQQLSLREGDRFQKGDRLLTMDCALYQARKKRVEAELTGARFALEAQQKLARLRTGSSIKRHEALANLAKVEADLLVIQVTLKMCAIHAPFQGLVVQRMANSQQYVSKGEPILEIMDDTTLFARLIVPSQWLLWLHKGEPFSFRLDETNQNYRAVVSHIGARIDPASQTVTLKGTIKGNHPELRAGMGGSALFGLPAPATP